MKHAWRLPILFLLAALLATAIVAQNRASAGNRSKVRLNEMVPTASADDALSSTWYCAPGTATGVVTGDAGGFAEQTLTIQNATGKGGEGSGTGYPERGVPGVKAGTVGA